jgi:ribosomal protein S18 acetylase RimI-like enzyme
LAGRPCARWLDGEVIGQIEARPRDDLLADKQTIGYIGLYYIAPRWRGVGYGAMLEDYVESWFRAMRCARLRLSVSPTNTAAWAFYVRQGWEDCGPRLGSPEVHVMEKWLPPNDTPDDTGMPGHEIE